MRALRLASRIRSMMTAWVVTSRPVVGSSAMRTEGAQASVVPAGPLRVTNADALLPVLLDGLDVAELPDFIAAEYLADAPVYERDVVRPQYLDEVQELDPDDFPEPEDYNAVLLQMLAHPNLRSRRPIFSQYDHQVGTDTVVLPGADAAGSTSSSGFSRKALRMICTVATPGRAIAVSASATVSTLTP